MGIPGDVQSGPPEPPGFAKEASSRLPAETFLADPNVTLKAALDEIPLVPGWNLLSVPEEPSDTSPASVLETIGGGYERIYTHDACDTADPWKVYDPNDPAASDLTALDHRMGFWADATLPVDLLSDGTLPATTTFELCEGWNLIGFPAGQARPVRNALASIEGKYIRIFGYDAADPQDPWEFFDIKVPSWANDLEMMEPGRGYWVLVTEPATVTIANDGPAPSVSLTVPEDLAVVTAPTDVLGMVESALLKEWTLSYRAVGEGNWIETASGVVPVASGKLGVFDPTLLLNGLYEIRLTASDYQGRTVESESIAVSVEGNMKIGNFTLSFVDLAIPLSGLDIEVVRTYDSRDKQKRDFGVGWTLDIRQGSYRNNRPPGDGWQIVKGFLPCEGVVETKSHQTTVRLSDREVYQFRLRLRDTGPMLGGCFARAGFEYVDGPLPGSTLKILGNDDVIYENGSDRVIDADSFEVFEPENVKLTTRDGRILHVNLETGVTHLEDLNGNKLQISPVGITHSSGRGVQFFRDVAGRIERIIDPEGAENRYLYDAAGDLVASLDRENAPTRFTYGSGHFLQHIDNSLGVRAVRVEYDDDGRMIRAIDANGKAASFAHDLDGRRELVTDRRGKTRIVGYDGRGNRVREIDEDGRVSTRSYDARDILLSETNAKGETFSQTFDAANQLTSFTDPLGNTTRWDYDSLGNVVAVTDPRGKVYAQTFDAARNLLSRTDPTGAIVTWTYDGSGNVLSETNTDGTTYFEYDIFGNLVRQTTLSGVETIFTYNARGERLSESVTRSLPGAGTENLTTGVTLDRMDRPVKITHPDDTSTVLELDALGQVTARIDPLGRTTAFEYDGLGQRAGTVLPDGSRETVAYDPDGRFLSRTDASGRVTSYVYDDGGRLVQTNFPGGTSSRRSYDAAGRLASITDTEEQVTSYVRDATGRIVEIVDPIGGRTLVTWDASGNRTSETTPGGTTTTFEYDDVNRLVRTVLPGCAEYLQTYDALGRVTSRTDPSGSTVRFTFDSDGRLIAVTDPLGGVTSFAYDALGNKISQTDALDRATRFEYDRRGREIRRTLPDGSTETKTWDAVGNLLTRTDFSGHTIQFSYNALDRLVEKRYPDGGTVSYAYTPTGHRAMMADSRGATTYTYDSRDRLKTMTTPDGRPLSYGYDAEGRRTSLIATLFGQTLTTRYTYDALGRLETVTDPEGRVYTHAYDANSNLTALSYPNGVETNFVYDLRDRVTHLTIRQSVGGTVLQSFAYALDPAGQRTQIDEAEGIRRSYTYDSRQRVTSEDVSHAGARVFRNDWSYDAVSNRTTLRRTDDTGAVTTTAYAYDLRDRLLTARNATSTWSINGNLTGREGAGYAWDFENRLVSATLADGTVVGHTYDGDGVLVRTTVTPPAGAPQVRDFLVDTSGGLSYVVATTDEAGTLTDFWVRGDTLFAALRPGEDRFFHHDGLGSVRLLTDEAAAETDAYAYDAFGGLLEHEGSDPNLFLFAGEMLDADTGFYSLRARWMDPESGRFISMDPFPGVETSPGSLQRYLYADANPVNVTDPSGLFGGGWIGGILLSSVFGAAPQAGTLAVKVNYFPLVVNVRPVITSKAWSHDEAWEQLIAAYNVFIGEPGILLRWEPIRRVTSLPEIIDSDWQGRSILEKQFRSPVGDGRTIPLLFIASLGYVRGGPPIVYRLAGIGFGPTKWGGTRGAAVGRYLSHDAGRGEEPLRQARYRTGILTTAHELAHAIADLDDHLLSSYKHLMGDAEGSIFKPGEIFQLRERARW